MILSPVVIHMIYIIISTNTICDCTMGQDFLYYKCSSKSINLDVHHLYLNRDNTSYYYFKDFIGGQNISKEILENSQRVGLGWTNPSIKSKSIHDTGKTVKYLGFMTSLFYEDVLFNLKRKKDSKLTITQNNQLRTTFQESSFADFFVTNSFANYLPFYDVSNISQEGLPPFIINEWSFVNNKKIINSKLEKIEFKHMSSNDLERIFSIFDIN